MMLVDAKSAMSRECHSRIGFCSRQVEVYQKYTIISTKLFLKIFSGNIIFCLDLIKIDDNNRKEFSILRRISSNKLFINQAIYACEQK